MLGRHHQSITELCHPSLKQPQVSLQQMLQAAITDPSDLFALGSLVNRLPLLSTLHGVKLPTLFGEDTPPPLFLRTAGKACPAPAILSFSSSHPSSILQSSPLQNQLYPASRLQLDYENRVSLRAVKVIGSCNLCSLGAPNHQAIELLQKSNLVRSIHQDVISEWRLTFLGLSISIIVPPGSQISLLFFF